LGWSATESTVRRWRSTTRLTLNTLAGAQQPVRAQQPGSCSITRLALNNLFALNNPQAAAAVEAIGTAAQREATPARPRQAAESRGSIALGGGADTKAANDA
jgi:hypothetical protein